MNKPWKPTWRVPRGKTAEDVTRDAVRQVIANYGPALRRLAAEKP